ncbi:acyltransferase family protein [Flavobacterium sp. U410]
MISEKQNKKRIFGLDVVRALAISLVVFSHLYYLIDSQDAFLISISGLAGYLGVEIFFVLSGFLIGNILLKQFLNDDFSFSNIVIFLKRRWFRTLPNYFLVLGIVFCIAYAYEIEPQWNSLWRYVFFLQNFDHYSITVFTESWSLSVEEWTYLLIPIVLWLVTKIQGNKKVIFLTTILGLIVLFHGLRFWHFYGNPITDMNVWNTALKSTVIYRIDSILYGFLVAWCYRFLKEQLEKLRVYFIIIAVHLIFFQYVVMNVLGFDLINTPLYYQVFYFTFSSITIALGLPFFVFWKNSKGIIAQATVFLSDISYSVYLLHYSVVSFVFKSYLLNRNTPLSSIFVISIYLFIIVLLSFVMRRFYEKPILQYRDRKY